MAKKIKIDKKKSRGLTKTFAFGGFEFDTPQDAIMQNQRAMAQATIDSMNDKGIRTMRNIGAGVAMAGQLAGKYGSMFAGGGNKGTTGLAGVNTELSAGGQDMSWLQKMSGSKFGKTVQGMVMETGGTVGTYDTLLTEQEELSYQEWKKKLPKNLQYEGDYDLRGLYKENPKIKARRKTHFPDTYKKPNHPTFSKKSIYSTDSLPGGTWDEETFLPAFWQNQHKYAMGGTASSIPVEVEGNEIGELPDGMLLNFEGPSHEEGGIPVDLPSGTKIYSDRVSIDGKTMAQRKARREKKIIALQNKVDKGDRIAKDTLKRYMLTSDKEEMLDMSIQQMLNEADNITEFSKGGRVKYKFGNTGTLLNSFEETKYGLSQAEMDAMTFPLRGILKSNTSGFTLNAPELVNTNAGLTKENFKSTFKPSKEQILTEKKGIEKEDRLGNLSGLKDMVLPLTGDGLGIYGNYQAGQANRKAITDYKAGMTANTNEMKHFGKEGLKTLDQSKQFARQMGEIQRSDIESQRRSATVNNRQTARSVNTMRALDLASYEGANRLAMQSYAQEIAQLQALLGQEAQMKNHIDQVVMGEEQDRDIRDRDDRAIINNMELRAVLAQANALSHTGKSLNDIAERKAKLNAMNETYANFEALMSGKLKGKKDSVVTSSKSNKSTKTKKDLGTTPEDFMTFLGLLNSQG